MLRAVSLGIINARVEAINNKIKVAIRMAYGFRNVDSLIALAMLRCSNMSHPFPGKRATRWGGPPSSAFPTHTNYRCLRLRFLSGCPRLIAPWLFLISTIG